MSSARDSDADVIIVGGGPVGMGLAIELGQRGVQTIVVERYREPQPIPKGQNLTQRSVEHFYFWGVEERIRRAAPIPASHGIGGLTAYGTLLSDYYYDWYQRALVRPFYFTDNERLPQYTTEQVLRQRVAELPSVQVLYDWSAETVSQDEQSAEVSINSRDGRERRSLRGHYLVGCDGSRSAVREHAGITQTRSDHDRRMVLLVFRSTRLNRLLERYPGKSFFNVLHPDLEGYWLFFGRVDLGETWFLHAPVSPETNEDNFDCPAFLNAAVGADIDPELMHIGFWDLRIAIADSYQKGRIFIAGDAAHSHPPYGGFGINTGFEDAKNLGWKLAATLQQWAGTQLLESYTLERRPVFASTARDFIERFIAQDRAFLKDYNPERDKIAFETAWDARSKGSGSDIRTFEPHYEGSPVIFGPPSGISSAIGHHRVEARAGHHLAPRKLSSEHDVYERLGPGFSLLAIDADDIAVTAFETAAREQSVPLTIIRDTRSERDTQKDESLVLIRPDQFIAWVGSSGDDADRILATVTGRS